MSSYSSIPSIIFTIIILILSLGLCFGFHRVSVDDYGATPNDGTPDNEAFSKAWNEACSKGAILFVPENQVYHLNPITFSGPCKLNTTFMVYGTIKAWPDMSVYGENPRQWITFHGITGLRVDGGGVGTFNGNGRKWWESSCKVNKTLPCTDAPTAITFYSCNDTVVEDVRSRNAQRMHINIQNSENVRLSGIKVQAPEDSPNTDGIHMTRVKNVFITNSIIRTGDDCISIESGSRNVKITGVTCGPGHGISVGSLGDNNSEAEVSNVAVNGAKFTGTTNGVRIKTWQGGSGYAKDIKFMNIEMRNVSNPIIIDQNYCDQAGPCHVQNSAVEVSNVLYKNIRGTSASEVAVKFDCSKTVPCKGVYVRDVNLEAEGGGSTTASCDNVNLVYGKHGALFPRC